MESSANVPAPSTPVSSTVTPSPVTASVKKSSSLLLTVLTVLGFALVVGAAVYIWQATNFKKQIDSLEKKIDDLEEELKSSDNNGDLNTEDSEDTEESTITSYNSDYDLYTNNRYGFSMLIPVEFYHGYGADCVWDNDSFRPAGAIVPTAVFEHANSIYITSEYFYNLTGESANNGYHTYSGCELITNSFAIINSGDYFQQSYWEIVAEEVNNEAELTTFIQNRFGGGCSLGTQTESSQSGVYDVSISGDFNIEDLDDPSSCPVNYAYIIKYYPARNIVVSWNLGQAITFASNENWTETFDQEMVDSFEFIE
ncbi:hypothetical protein JW962_00815 [Candidatus Dojkabacteria bacterium]|nr:hypothetical protein [Candidatus Dojkabacteria bacterium]